MMNNLITVENGNVFLNAETSNSIVTLEKAIKELKEREDALKKAVIEEMEAKGVIKVDTPDLTITYIQPTDREDFDKKAFRKDHADMYDEYVRMTPVKASVRIKVK